MSRKFKLLISLFICLMALSPINAKASETTHVKDYLNYLSETEVQELQNRINEISSKYSLDTVVVITDNTDGKSSMQYADDFFDNNNYGLDEEKSGILMLINMNAREVWISTKGKAIAVFQDSTIDLMVKDVTKYLSKQNYHGASDKFLEKVNYYCNKKLKPNNKNSNSTENVPPELSPDSEIDSGSESSSDTEVNPAPASYFSRLKDKLTDPTTYMFSFIVSIIVTVVVTKKSKWKVTVNSKTYEGNGSFSLTNKEDIFVSENTTKTMIQKKSKESNSVKRDRYDDTTYRSNSVERDRYDDTTYRSNSVKKDRNYNTTYRSNSVERDTNASTTHRSNSGSTHGGGGGSF